VTVAFFPFGRLLSVAGLLAALRFAVRGEMGKDWRGLGRRDGQLLGK